MRQGSGSVRRQVYVFHPSILVRTKNCSGFREHPDSLEKADCPLPNPRLKRPPRGRGLPALTAMTLNGRTTLALWRSLKRLITYSSSSLPKRNLSSSVSNRGNTETSRSRKCSCEFNFGLYTWKRFLSLPIPISDQRSTIISQGRKPPILARAIITRHSWFEQASDNLWYSSIVMTLSFAGLRELHSDKPAKGLSVSHFCFFASRNVFRVPSVLISCF